MRVLFKVRKNCTTKTKYKDVFGLVFVVEFEYICRKKPVIIISLILFYKQSTNSIFQTDLMTTGKELWYLSLLQYYLFASKTKIISPITSPYKLFFRKRFLPAAWKRNISIYLSIIHEVWLHDLLSLAFFDLGNRYNYTLSKATIHHLLTQNSSYCCHQNVHDL